MTMTQDKRKSNKDPGKANHKADTLFTEWPAPSDTVEGFGGNPDKASQKQWKSKKDNNQ
jgi:hypothetical protein